MVDKRKSREEAQEEPSFEQVWLQNLSEERIKDLAELTGIEKNAIWYARVAKVLRDAGHNDPAIPLFIKALEMDPSLWTAQEGLSFCYENQEEWQKAIDCLKEAVAAIPREKDTERARKDEADALNWMSTSYIKLGKVDEAVDVTQKAYSLNSDDTEVQYGVINALNAAGWWDKVMEFLELLKATYPNPSEEEEQEGSDEVVKQTSLAKLISNPPQYDLNDIIITAARNVNKLDFIADAIKETIEHAKRKKNDLLVAMQRYKLADLYLSQAEENPHKIYEGIATFEQLLTEATLAKLDGSDDYVWRVQWSTKRRLARLCFEEACNAKDEGKPYKHYLSKLQDLAGETKDPDEEDVYNLDGSACMLGLWYRLNGQMDKARACLRSSILQAIQILQDDDPSNDRGGWVDLSAALNYAGDMKNAAAVYMVTVNGLDKLKEDRRVAEEAEKRAKEEAEKEGKDRKIKENIMPISEVREALASGDSEKLENVAPVVVPVLSDPENPDEKVKPTKPPFEASNVVPESTTAPTQDDSEQPQTKPSEPTEEVNDDQTWANWSCDGHCMEKEGRESTDWNEVWFCQNCFDTCFCDKCFAKLQSGEKTFGKCQPRHKFMQVYPIRQDVMDICSVKEDGVIKPKQEWLEVLKKEWEEGKKE